MWLLIVSYQYFFLEKLYKVKTKVVAIDFTADSSIYDSVKRAIEGLEVGVLGNIIDFSLFNIL